MAETTYLYAGICLVIGLILGVILTRLMTPGYKKNKQIQQDFEKAKFELNQQRQDLVDHFQSSAHLLDDLGKSYTKLYQHLQKTSSELLPDLPQQDNPFIETRLDGVNESALADSNTDAEIDNQPKDYAQGSSGLLSSESSNAHKSKENKDEAQHDDEKEPKPKASS